MQNKYLRGFTLVELAIVLVIIGLIVGGVLVGQDMIKSAAVRTTIGQLEKYNSAVNTFRTKYIGLPGDLSASHASDFGFATRAGSSGRGDSNGLLEGGWAASSLLAGENALFWADLGQANLVAGNFQGVDCQALSGSCTSSSASIHTAQIIPLTAIGNSNHFTVYGTGGVNYYQVIGPLLPTTGIGSGGTFAVSSSTPSLTSQEAFIIDTKMDDGAPLAGIVRSANTTSFGIGVAPDSSNTTGVAGDIYCVITGGASPVYNTTSSARNCSLQIRFN